MSKSSLSHLSSEKPRTPKTAPKPAPISPTKQLKSSKTQSQVMKESPVSSNSTSSAGLVKKSMTTTQLGNTSRQRVNNTGEENAELKGMFMKMKQSRAALLVEEETSRIKLDMNEEEEDTSGTCYNLVIDFFDSFVP